MWPSSKPYFPQGVHRASRQKTTRRDPTHEPHEDQLMTGPQSRKFPGPLLMHSSGLASRVQDMMRIHRSIRKQTGVLGPLAVPFHLGEHPFAPSLAIFNEKPIRPPLPGASNCRALPRARNPEKISKSLLETSNLAWGSKKLSNPAFRTVSGV